MVGLDAGWASTSPSGRARDVGIEASALVHGRHHRRLWSLFIAFLLIGGAPVAAPSRISWSLMGR